MPVQIGPKIGIEGEKAYRDSINNIIQQAKTLKSEMGALTSSFDNEKKSIKDNNEQRKLLNEQIKTQQDRVSKLNEMYQKSAEKTGENSTATLKWKEAVQNAQTQLNEYQNELKKLPDTLELVGQKMETIGGKISGFGQGLSDAGRTLSRYVTAPIVGAGAASVKFGAEFDHQMSSVQAVTNATAEDMAKMRDIAIDQGEKTVYTAKEAGDALYYMGLAGWSADEAVSALPGVLSLAAAGNLDLGRTSDIVTDYMTALQIPVNGYTNSIKNAEHFSNVLAATMSNSNTTADLMGETFKFAAPVAGALGYSIEDLSLATGLMANNGIKASIAGTTLRNIFTNMADPTDKMATAMDRLGISLDDGRGNAYSFLEIMEQMRAGFAGHAEEFDTLIPKVNDLADQLESGAINEEEFDVALDELTGSVKTSEGAWAAQTAAMLGGKRGMAGILAIANTTDEEFQALKDAIYGADDAFDGLGSAAGMAQQQMDNLQGDWTKFTSALGTSKILLSDTSKGALRDLVQRATELVNKFNALDQETKSQIVQWAGFAAALGPALLIFGKITKGVGNLVIGLGKFIGHIPKIVSGVKMVGGFLAPVLTSLKAVVAFIAANPITLVIGALVAALILVVKHWDMVKETALEFFGWVGEKFTALKEAVANFATSIKEGLGNAWDGLKESAANAWNGVKEGFTNAMNAILANPIVQSIVKMVTDQFNIMKSTISTIWDGIKKAAKAAWELIKNIVLGPVLLLIDLVTLDFANMKTDIEGIWNNLKTYAGQLWEALKQIVVALVKGLADSVTARFDNMKNIAQTIWTTLKNAVVNAAKNLANSVKTAFTNLKTSVQNTWNNMKTYAVNTWQDIKNKVVEFAKNMVQGIKDNVSGVEDAVKNGFQGAIDFITGLPSKALEWGKDFVDGLINGIKEKIGGIRDAVSEVGDNIRSFLHFSEPDEGPLSNFHTWMPDMMSSMAKGIKDNMWMVEDAVSGLAGGMANGMNGNVTNMGGVTIVVNGAAGQDVNELANIVMDRLTVQTMRQGLAYGGI